MSEMNVYADDKAHEAPPDEEHGHRIGDSIDRAIRHPGTLTRYQVIDDDDGGYAAFHRHEVVEA